MVKFRKCACSTLIVWDRLLSLRKDVVELKYTVDPEKQRDTWRYLNTVATEILKDTTPLVKRDCEVDLEEERGKIEEAIKDRNIEKFDEAVREMTFKMYSGVCK